MAKYENIRALAKKQLQAVTESSDRWKAFLRTAAIAYNYSFPNQLLIHEQSPTATAVADIAYWNNNAGRWVKRGAHGIAVFDTRANSSRLRYLFDISDTIPRAEIPEALPWVITDQNWRPVWDKIVADNHADSIQSALLMLSTSCVAQRSAMFTTALGKAIDGSSLQWAKPDEQRQLFLQLITQSCLYMAALRCGVDTARLDLSALESVNQFDTNRITLCLGSACQQAARPLMQQIGSITREIDSVARAEKVRYYGDKQEETNNTKEVNNGVHDGERLPNPGADAERAADARNRQIRQPAAEFSARERADDVRRDDAGGNAVPASGGDGQRSTSANRADDADADAAEHRPEPADRPDGLDAVDERLAGPSRGTGDAADLQPVTQEPQAESDTTPSAFSVPISDLPPLSDELILGLLAKDSSSRADNAAILEYFNEHPDLAERSAFCKHCYKQIYTYLFVDDHTVGFIRHDMYLELWEGNYLTKTAQVNLTWDAVAAKIADLIEQGRLMVPIKAAPVQQQMEQLTLTPEDSEKAGLPSHEQQVKNIDLAAEAKKWNKPIIDASGKYISEQDITDALCRGSAFEDSKFRIQQYLSAQVLPIEEDQARWLKKEYGIGGGTWIFRDGGHGFLDHMGKNLEITRRTEDGEYRRVLKWKEVAQRLRLLLENALNLRATKIYDTVYDENGKEQHKLNGPATEEAQAKQRMIEDAFKDWIFKDRERRESLVALYNEKFNCIRPREYDGSHIQFFGMNPEIALRPHQRNAIAHILYGHNTLLAHVVGAGKTYEMVAAAMEKKRLGLCSKTLVAVPNHLTGQFASEALKLYPNANILVTTQRDFEKSNRKRFCAKIATGNYDIVVIGHSQFEKIPLSDARKAEFIRKQIDELEMQLESMDNSDSRLTVKQLESKKKQLKTKLSNLLDAPKRDDVVTFEELGADSLMVDEAHNFKNLMTVTKMHNIAGISTTESQKASDLFMKCQYLDEITGARGVTFATGTPISNSMTELYTMQRYLQQYTLERNGLANFDSWAATFGETVTAIELAPEGTGYRTKTRFARFFNLPELMAMFKECADIQTADMLKLPVPALVGGKPTNIQLKPSEIQKQMVTELGERADKIRNKMVKPYEDNMLKITNDGRKLALDQRLIDPDLPDDPDSKVNICVGKIFEIWEQTMPQRSAQLVFCDLSTPKAGVFNVYDDMKAKLIERGIPETEIAFIHEANTDARKTELFGKVRSGAVRVLMGSTAKMGAGTNVQKRLIALHHLDVPWRPSDIEQREGRILRQGNENKEVYVFRYVTEGTFDAYSWQLIENKQKFIGQIMTSKSPARSCNDMDEAALSYAEVKALAAGNPLIKEKMDLDVQLTRLKTLKAAHDSQRYELENKIAIGFPAEIRKCKEQIENATVDAATVKEHSVVDADGKDVFCIQLEKKVYYEKEPAGKALLGLLGLALNSEKPVPIGYFKGMELQIQHLPFGNEYHARLAGSGTYSTQLGADVLGNLTRLSNLANGIEPSIEKTRNMQIQLEQQLASAEEEVKRPFPQATELTEKSKRLAVLEGLLNMNDKDIVTDTEPEQQCQTDNRQRGQEER
jgi:SNF2 family DNA or RNA helicase